jgi:hypothetical protein
VFVSTSLLAGPPGTVTRTACLACRAGASRRHWTSWAPRGSAPRCYPGRFGLSAVLPLPDVDGALAELGRVYSELGADAIALETNYHGRYLSNQAFAPVLPS